MTYDFVVIGAGIVGLSTAWQLKNAAPDAKILVVEKEAQPGMHQTGHNSGVVHAGVYYAAGSAKARMCKEGAQATKWFCETYGVLLSECGKLLVATNETENDRIAGLKERCHANGIAHEVIGPEELKELEPAIAGLRAIRVPSTAITDYPGVCRKLLELFSNAGGEARFGLAVEKITEKPGGVELRHAEGVIEAKCVVACAGVQADRIVRCSGRMPSFAMVPFRGEYFRLPSDKNSIVKHLIYPIPDPALPFLGVHLTPMINGSITVGPNAVLGFAREGYRKGSVNLRDVGSMFGNAGFWRMIAANMSSGLSEMGNSLIRRRYLALCQKYCPQLTLSDLEPYPAGIRAQAITPRGELIHDFVIEQTERVLHVCNAPSPAATSALPIGRHIVNLVRTKAEETRLKVFAEEQAAPWT